ncbi:MAG: MlaD family protein [Thermonemataceae bacterium]
MKISKEFRVGVIALGSMVILYFGFNFLKGSDFLSSTNYYYATYPDIGGLTISNPVKINGYVVGRVKEIDLMAEKANQIRIKMEIDDELAVTEGTKALLKDDGLLGSKMVELQIGKSNKTLESGAELASALEENMVAELQSYIPELKEQLDTTLFQLNALLKDFNGVGGKVGNLLDTYNSVGVGLKGTLDDNRQGLTATVGNLRSLSASLSKMGKEFEPVVGKMNAFADSLSTLELKQTVANANQSIAQLQGVLKKVDDGEGTLGALVNDDSLYNNLNALSIDLDKLLIDLRKNPKRYVKISVF